MPVALVTGASRGIGRAISAEFEAKGWNVLRPARTELDLADPGSIRDWCDSLGDQNINAFVHSAGVNWPKPLAEITDDIWAATLQINLTAFRQLTQALVPRLHRGRIVALSSIFGVVTRANRSAYSASKAALNGFVRTLAVELGESGVLANTLCPGYIDTDLTRQNNSPEQIAAIAKTIPLGRLGTPQEIARLALWLCSDDNTYLTGQSVVIDGGFTCL